MIKIDFITGATGRHGASLAELMGSGYEIHGIKRRTSFFNTGRIDHLYESTVVNQREFILHHGGPIDSLSLIRIIQKAESNEIYNEV